jgi:glucoamylase
MEFLVTDGETFFHEEKRNLDSTISYIEEHTLGYRTEGSIVKVATAS